MSDKTYYPPRPQSQEFMGFDQQKHWDKWCLAHIEKQLRTAVDGIAVGAGQMHRDLQRQITELRAEVDALRSEIIVVKSENVAKLRGSVG
jgi:hypothetical protein